MSVSRAPVPSVVQQHAGEVVVLRNTRSSLVTAPHVRLDRLGRLDDRLVAHLDGLSISGKYGNRLVHVSLAGLGVGEAFAATVLAIEDHDAVGLERLLALAESHPDAKGGLLSAFGWVSAPHLRGITKALLESPSAFNRQMGLAACSMHQVDPGDALVAALGDDNPALRARALRSTGDLGRRDLFRDCVGHLRDEEPECRYWAARSAALLGERYASIHSLHEIAHAPGARSADALSLLLKLGSPEQVVPILRGLFLAHAEDARTLIKGLGVVGDPQLIPWLIDQMNDLTLARLAGESFSTVTGLDLAGLDLELRAPDGIDFGPNDDPEDDDVAMDEDDGLPWPDPVKIQAWWHANAHDYQAGQRYFMGQPPSWEHCLQVRKDGFQRQRIAASEWLCLLQPGTPLFPTSAPAWRQQRWLESMHG